MSRLVDHARAELHRCGQWDEDPAYAQSVISTIAAFASFGHSGASYEMAVHQLTRLLRRETLTPLTNDPAEWEDRSGISSVPMWQNTRNPAAISYDAGRTYHLMTDDDTTITYTSAPATGPERACADPAPQDAPTDPETPGNAAPAATAPATPRTDSRPEGHPTP